MAWSVAYLFMSFQTPLPWIKKQNFLVTEFGEDDNVMELRSDSPFNEAYFADEILQRTESISDTGRIVPLIAISLLISYILVYFTIWKGVESTGKIVYVTAPLPYLLLLILLIRGLTLDGAKSGIVYLFYPDWSKLANFKVWRDGINQIIFSSGIAFGPLTFYSSCR